MRKVPPEMIAATIVKEVLPASLPDDILILNTLHNGTEHTYGVGAIFPYTARTAWTAIDNDTFVRRMYEASTRDNSLSVNQNLAKMLFLDDKFSI